MNRTIKSLILAAGVAAATLTVTVAPAQADPNGPGGIQIGPIVDPEPQPEPQPQPPTDGLGEITDKPNCTHGCGGDQDPMGPKDIAPAPTEDVINGGPLEAADPTDDPANDAPLDQGCFTGCDLPEEPAQPEAETEAPVQPAQLDSAKPSVFDAVDFEESDQPVVDQADHGYLLWLLIGGGALSALLLAAVIRRRQQADQA